MGGDGRDWAFSQSVLTATTPEREGGTGLNSTRLPPHRDGTTPATTSVVVIVGLGALALMVWTTMAAFSGGAFSAGGDTHVETVGRVGIGIVWFLVVDALIATAAVVILLALLIPINTHRRRRRWRRQ